MAAERDEDLLGGALGVAGARDVGEQDAEAVALHARDEVGGSHRALEPRGDLLEDGVALRAAERVVHVAEAVEVDDEEHGLLGLVVLGRAERAADRLEEQRAVGEPGERVVEREVLHLGGLLAGQVHRGHREREERDEVEPVLGHDRHRRAEREQRAGGPAAEDEVGAEVVGDRGLLEERLGCADECGVGGEEDDGRERDGREVARREVACRRGGRCCRRGRARARRAPTRWRAGRG